MSFTLSTPRLDLVLEGTSALEAFLRSRGELASILGVDVPPDWPVCGSAVIGYVIDWLREDPDIGGFGAYFIVHRADNRLIGDGGFKGRPNDRGEVEVGYAIIEAYRGQGYATEAARAFVDWAFTPSSTSMPSCARPSTTAWLPSGCCARSAWPSPASIFTPTTARSSSGV